MTFLLPALVTSVFLGNAAAPAGAEDPPPSAARLVSLDDLQKRLADPDLRLLDARPRPAYDQGHIPGAVWVDIDAARKLSAQPEGLTARAAWETWTASLGIGPATEVLIYDANRQLDAARLWWLLGYLGAEKVGLIDGGFPLWEKQGRPVTKDVTPVKPGSFRVHFRAERLATRSDVLEAIRRKSAQVIDARSEAEYQGTQRMSNKRGGHIPSACNLEWSGLVDENRRFLDPKTLRAKLEALGVKTGTPVITHCQSGGRASVDAFVLERLGFAARNYYLGWSDWGNVEETPIAQ